MDKAAIISLEVSLDYILIYIYIYTSLDGSDMLYIDICTVYLTHSLQLEPGRNRVFPLVDKLYDINTYMAGGDG